MDRKQSAFARRLNKNLETFTGSVDNSTNKTLSSHILYSSKNFSDISNKLQSVSLSTVSNYSEFMVEKDLSNPLSWESRITDLENNPSGGGGIDPTDPDQPIILWDNFINQSNGDESGTVTPYPYLTPRPTSSQLLTPTSLQVFEANSETNHIGVVEIKLPAGNGYGYLSLVNDPSTDSFTFSDFNTTYFIIKLLPYNDDYEIQLGLFDNVDSYTEGIFFRIIQDVTGIKIYTRVEDTSGVSSNQYATLTTNTWYILKIQKKSSSSVGFTVNGGAEDVIILNIPTSHLTSGINIQNNTNNPQDISFKLDFFSLKLKDTGIVTPGTTIVGTANEVDVTTVGTVITVGLPTAIIVNEATVDQLNFTMPVASPTLSMGELAWDPDHNTIVYQLSSTVHVPLGTAVYQHVRNQSGVNILKGDIVYVSGSQGVDRLKVTKALANAEATSAPTIGLAAEDINNNADGYVVTYGLLHGVTTTGYSDGQRIYLSETTAGAWRTSLPTAPNHGTFVGWVVKGNVGGGAGSIFVKVHNYNELDELSDVYVNTVANGDLLQWNNSTLRWENKSLSSAGIAASSHTHTLSNITQSGASLNQVPQWNGTAWVANSISGGFTPQRTVFASSGSFTIPSGANMLRIICVGGGGGGGGGCLSNSTSSNRCGGAGGGGGSVNIATYLVSTLASPLTITIGTGGSQGGGAVTNGSNGSNGGPGGVTTVTSPSFNGIAGTTRICWGANGLGGSGGAVGSTSSTAGGGGAQGYTGGAGGNGASGTGSIGNQTSSSGGLSFSPYGGGGGGGINSSNTHSAGGNCFGMYPFNDSNTTAGTAGGGAGPAATATRGTSHDWGNVGGSGGGGNNAGAGGAGGAGIYGSGGGGGGAGSSTSGGTGGLGGSGLVIIYSL